MKIKLELAVPLPVYTLTDNIKVALDKHDKYIYVKSELWVRDSLCVAIRAIRTHNIEVDIPEGEESQFTVIHLVLFKMDDYNYQPLTLSKEEYNEALESYRGYLKIENPAFLKEHFLLGEDDSMLLNFELLHKSSSLPFTLIEPVKEVKQISAKEISNKNPDIAVVKPVEHPGASWLNYKTGIAALVTVGAMGFFALKTIAEVSEGETISFNGP